MTPDPPSRKSAFSLRNYRILEIGNGPNLKRLLPDQTTFYYIGRRSDAWKARETEKGHSLVVDRNKIAGEQMTFANFMRVVRALRRGVYDVVSVTPAAKPICRADRSWLSKIVGALPLLFTKFRLFGIHAIRFASRKKFRLIVIDRQDEPTVRAHNLWLLARCDLYFKRELPLNYWKLFLQSSGADADISHIRAQPIYQRLVRRLRPLSMPVSIDPSRFQPLAEKTYDLFYAGNPDSSTARALGLRALENLRQKGYRVDFSVGGIPYSEYLERCRRSWLVWSPEGQGWHTWRHYEAVMMGSVPVINYPGILRYKPLIDGEHCFYYACEGDSLEQTIIDALWDKQRLFEMTRGAQEHLRRFYSREAMITYFDAELAGTSDLVADRAPMDYDYAAAK